MKKLEVPFFSKQDISSPEYRAALPAGITPIMMNEFESAFLAGLLENEKPKNVLELGVSAGGTTCLIHDVLKKASPGAMLHSVDLYEDWFDDPAYKTGYLATAYCGGSPSWKLHTGKYFVELVSTFSQPFDFVILDTVHFFPGELLDLLVVLTNMTENAIILLHDINLASIGVSWQREAFATKLIYDAIVGEKFITLESNHNLPNIGALRINHDTYKYIENLFLLFSFKWEYLIPEVCYKLYHTFYEQYYGEECAEYFLLSYEPTRCFFKKLESELTGDGPSKSSHQGDKIFNAHLTHLNENSFVSVLGLLRNAQKTLQTTRSCIKHFSLAHALRRIIK